MTYHILSFVHALAYSSRLTRCPRSSLSPFFSVPNVCHFLLSPHLPLCPLSPLSRSSSRSYPLYFPPLLSCLSLFLSVPFLPCPLSSLSLFVIVQLGCTPLHRAAGAGQLSLCELLVEEGADVEATDSGGQTPLMAAVTLTAAPASHIHSQLLLALS